MAQNLKLGLLSILYFIRYNIFLLFLTGLFAYRTFFVGRLNYALLVLLISLALIIVCRVIYRYSKNTLIKFFYRLLILVGTSLLISAIGIQTLRFVYTFATTFNEPTLPKILVRIGIVTANFYAFALIFAFIYYLYVHEMLAVIWNGSLNRVLRGSSPRDRHNNWRRERFSSLVFLYTLFWGGLASVITLGIGFIAWLLR